MILRWLHKIWKSVWAILIIALLCLLLAGVLLFGAMQLPQSRSMITDRLQQMFNEQYDGTLVVDDIGGMIPFNVTLRNARVYAPDDSEVPVITVPEASLRINAWDLFRRTITISRFELIRPELSFRSNNDGNYTIIDAFRHTFRDSTQNLPQRRRNVGPFQVYAPQLLISNGGLTIDTSLLATGLSGEDQPVVVENLQTSVFLDLDYNQRLMDVEHFSADLPGTLWERIFFNGQIYSDGSFLELNGFTLTTSEFHFEFSAEATPVNLLSPDLREQLDTATYRFNLQNSSVSLNNLSAYLPGLNDIDASVELDLEVNGTTDSLWVDNLLATTPQSSLMINGLVQKIGAPDFSYNATLTNLIVGGDELQQLIGRDLSPEQISYYSSSRLGGRLRGTLDSLSTELRLDTPEGMAQADADMRFSPVFSYNASLQTDSLNIAHLIPDYIERSSLSGNIEASGTGTRLSDLQSHIQINLSSGTINQVQYESGTASVRVSNGIANIDTLELKMADAALETSGRFRITGPRQDLIVDGTLDNINLRDFLLMEGLPETALNMSFHAEVEGSDQDDLFGRLNYEVEPSMVREDSIRAHQLYIDLNAPGNGPRTLRLTSTFMDGQIDGDITPSNLSGLYEHWKGYIDRQLTEEVFLDTLETPPLLLNTEDSPNPANLQIALTLKDPELLQRYFMSDPFFDSRAQLNVNVNADAERLVVTGSTSDPDLRYKNMSADDLRGNFTAGLRYNESLKEYSTLDTQLNASQFTYRNFDFSDVLLNTAMRDDSVRVNFESVTTADDVRFDFVMMAKLMQRQIEFNVREFQLGNETYLWTSEELPRFVYTESNTLIVDNLILSNETERIEVNGTFSSAFSDSVEYNVSNLQLDKISSLLGGQIAFNGLMNGNFVTRSLTQVPSFQGELTIDEFRVNERLIGDVAINSVYSPDEERFNTDMRVFTDPGKYPEYFAANDSIGNELQFTGFIAPPDPEQPEKELFNFDADLTEIDMWIVKVIVPGIVEEIEGRASGNGTISGTSEDYDFNFDFTVSDVIGKPVLLNTVYTINGDLEFDKQGGLDFNNVTLTDSEGGSGLLTGNVNPNSFTPTTDLDLTLDMDNLHIFNNPFDPDVAFFANARGSGQLRITGTNFAPYLRTSQPISLSQNSSISIPLLGDTDLERTYNFIRFVDEFDSDTGFANSSSLENGGTNPNGQNGSTTPENLTFVERFTLDLQFNENDPIEFQLIFDPVTNEILRANGTGQMRLALEDQQFSMYGRMNIQSGEYQFVAGDILSRRFLLQEGGAIVWEGDPANARLDVNAVYSARPDFSTLQAATTGVALENNQRFQVDLILNIGGTLGEPVNDFFFSVPSGIQGTLDPAITTQINSLNRNEEEKLLQATSILLTGSFISQTTVAESGSGAALRQGLPGGGAMVISPFISSQVINPLLSDQISSLLRSDMSLDFDVNLTPYNQIDLGVALRLYNDRLILRRDGQITGAQSDIGDLGATYRISRTFALTAFHRQDPTLSNTSGTETRQVQEMNGIGLEAQVQFNTWQELGQRIRQTFNRLFGIKESEEDVDEQTGEPLVSDQ